MSTEHGFSLKNKRQDETKQQFHQRAYLARMAINGAKKCKKGVMCGTCAFKFNSDANLEPDNVDAAFRSVAFYGQFNCHKEAGVDKGCSCIGFEHAKQMMK